jgi:hypothetical protein
MKENWTISQGDWSAVLPLLFSTSQVIRLSTYGFAEITNGMFLKARGFY